MDGEHADYKSDVAPSAKASSIGPPRIAAAGRPGGGVGRGGIGGQTSHCPPRQTRLFACFSTARLTVMRLTPKSSAIAGMLYTPVPEASASARSRSSPPAAKCSSGLATGRRWRFGTSAGTAGQEFRPPLPATSNVRQDPATLYPTRTFTWHETPSFARRDKVQNNATQTALAPKLEVLHKLCARFGIAVYSLVGLAQV
jgi:hypothetical protein